MNRRQWLSTALGASAVEKVFTVIRKLRDEGCCILFISHRFHEVEALADTISVFRAGQHVRTFPAGTIDNQSIVSLMIGETMFVSGAAMFLTAPVAAAPFSFSAARIGDDVKTLASDAFAGRGPGEVGEAQTLAFLAARFQAAGLEPAGPSVARWANLWPAGRAPQKAANCARICSRDKAA